MDESRLHHHHFGTDVFVIIRHLVQVWKRINQKSLTNPA